jgi:hypothetical protein
MLWDADVYIWAHGDMVRHLHVVVVPVLGWELKLLQARVQFVWESFKLGWSVWPMVLAALLFWGVTPAGIGGKKVL